MKKILLQLNNLKNIKADSDWKYRSREILLSQISGSVGFGEGEKIKQLPVSYYFRNFLRQPAMVVTAVLFVVFGGGALSIHASFGTKPGDSLYIAKIISEKAQLAITFDEKEKAKLNIEFAKNRAKEIAQVLESDDNGEEKAATVEKLSNNFKKEIFAGKERLNKSNIVNNETRDNGEVFSANVGKSDQGIEIYDIKNDGQENIVKVSPTETATSSMETPAVRRIGINETINEAEKLFSEQNYSEVLNKLEEAGAIIDGAQPVQDESGENVLGEKSKSATSTGG